jgi:hypothetical protein
MNIKSIINALSRNNPTSNFHHKPPAEHHTSSDQLLIELSQYGRPKLLQTESGWWCFIEISNPGVGAKFTIGSEIRHRHPMDAIAQCLQRVQDSGLARSAL